MFSNIYIFKNLNLVFLIHFYYFEWECNKRKMKEFIFFDYICLLKINKEIHV